ncbi:MAG: hypothetical protein ACQEWV_17775 [Bacillota bacterium]
MHLAGKTHIFKKEMTDNNEVIYSFRLNDKAVKQSIAHPDAEKIVFVFSDTEIIVTGAFIEQVLVFKKIQ